jgi:succinyl-CoA synthetase alpha subunit
MAILIDERSRVLVQGITGREGTLHAARMRAAGTNLVAGVSPGKGGQTVEGAPVYDAVAPAVAASGADVAVLFVPARFARDAMIEAADAGIRLVVCVTEGIPTRDMAEVTAHLSRRDCALVGPNGPGLITPRRCSAGIMPADVFIPGGVGLVSRSGTLTYEVVH